MFVAPVKAVGDDAVLAGRQAGGHVRLHGARDRGEAGRQFCVIAIAHQGREPWHQRDVLAAEARNSEQDYIFRHKDFARESRE
jgi:hypothetical protein